mgnify:CR=1 FL=1
MNFARLSVIAVAVSAAMVAGCAHKQKAMEFEKQYPTTMEKSMEFADTTWGEEAGVVKEGTPMVVLMTPFSVPDEIRRKTVKLELEPGATVKDVVAILGNLGHSIILADKEAGEKDFFLPRYNGNLGNLLSALSRAADVWFTYHNGVINVSSVEKVALSLPQEEGLATKVGDGLKSMNVENMVTSWEAGMVSMTLKPSQLQKVKTFLDRMTKNAALVTLQVAIVNVTLNQDSNQGIDWNKLQLAVGSDSKNQMLGQLNPPSQAAATGAGQLGGFGQVGGINPVTGLPFQQQAPVPTTGTPTTQNAVPKLLTGTGGATVTGYNPATGQQVSGTYVDGKPGTVLVGGTEVSGVLDLTSLAVSVIGGAAAQTAAQAASEYAANLRQGLVIGQGGLIRGALTNSAFSMLGFVNFLQTYGTTETKQNVMLKTVTGNKVELKSVQKVPYVSNIGVTTTGANGLGGIGGGINNGLGNALGSARTETAEDGITLAVTPAYDASSNTVTVNMELSIQAVIGFNNLSAGNQLGTLSQPTTAERSFNDILRVRPGQTVVVGGITYDSVAKNNGGPVMFTGSKAESESYKVTRQTMFIVMRPTVTSYGAMAEQENMNFFQSGEYVAPPSVEKRAKSGKSKSKRETSETSNVATPRYTDADFIELK